MCRRANRVRVEWPAGPRVDALDPAAPSGYAAWAVYKMWSANWHIETLAEVLAVTGDQQRWLGVEMAIDGAVGSMSSAFDSAMVALICAVEASGQAVGVPPTPPYQYGVRALRTAATAHAVTVNCLPDIDLALDGESQPVPVGWLARLRRLRNRVTHAGTVGRHFNVGGEGPYLTIVVPGAGTQDLKRYLTVSLGQTESLVRQMLIEAYSLAPNVVLQVDAGTTGGLTGWLTGTP